MTRLMLLGLLTVEELAIRLGMISKDGTPNLAGLAKWRFHGEGPKWVRKGMRIYYPIEEVEKWESLIREGEADDNKEQ